MACFTLAVGRILLAEKTSSDGERSTVGTALGGILGAGVGAAGGYAVGDAQYRDAFMAANEALIQTDRARGIFRRRGLERIGPTGAGVDALKAKDRIEAHAMRARQGYDDAASALRKGTMRGAIGGGLSLGAIGAAALGHRRGEKVSYETQAFEYDPTDQGVYSSHYGNNRNTMTMADRSRVVVDPTTSTGEWAEPTYYATERVRDATPNEQAEYAGTARKERRKKVVHGAGGALFGGGVGAALGGGVAGNKGAVAAGLAGGVLGGLNSFHKARLGREARKVNGMSVSPGRAGFYDDPNLEYAFPSEKASGLADREYMRSGTEAAGPGASDLRGRLLSSAEDAKRVLRPYALPAAVGGMLGGDPIQSGITSAGAAALVNAISSPNMPAGEVARRSGKWGLGIAGGAALRRAVGG